MARKISTKMVSLREIKKDHTVLKNDFFKADPFIQVKLTYSTKCIVVRI